jgi:plasmid stabilization system protein ParE
VRRVRVRELARTEIADAFAWYSARSSVAGGRFIDEVEDAIRAIEADPERNPAVRGAVRRILLKRFPYGVYYKIYPTVISVLGVIHGHRHPDVWQHRGEP